MTGAAPSLEEISAYVDGELDARTAARIARAVSEDRELAHKVAVLTQLKALVPDAAGQDQTPPLAAELEAGGSEDRRTTLLAPLAVVAMLVLFIGGAVGLHLSQTPAVPSWFERGLALHADWRDNEKPEYSLSQAGPVLASLTRLGPGLDIPDLSSAKLSLALVRRVETETGRDGLHLGYRGSRGCQVSLLAFGADPRLSNALLLERRGPVAGYLWRTGRIGYLLLAEGMDPERLRLIAESVQQSTRDALPFDEETRTALSTSREESQPCLS